MSLKAVSVCSVADKSDAIQIAVTTISVLAGVTSSWYLRCNDSARYRSIAMAPIVNSDAPAKKTVKNRKVLTRRHMS